MLDFLRGKGVDVKGVSAGRTDGNIIWKRGQTSVRRWWFMTPAFGHYGCSTGSVRLEEDL